MKIYDCYFDGACEPTNPGGKIGFGIYITDGKKEYIKGFYKEQDPSNTNNVAEYMALIEILKLFKNKRECHINIHGDSLLVIKQMNGEWKSKGGAYAPYFKEAKKLYNELLPNNCISLKWIPRELNSKADEQSRIRL